MKKLLAFLALTTMVGQAQAADGEMSTSAEFRLRHQIMQDDDFNADAKPSSEDSTSHRMKMGLTFRSGQKFTGHMTILHNSTWGANSTDSSFPGGNTEGTTFTGFESQSGLLVNEAYGAWMVNDEFSLRAGRGGFTMADGTVISQNDWQAVPVSFEGVMGTYDTEFARFNFWGVQFAEFGTATGSSDDESNSLGLSVDFKSLGDFLKMANLNVFSVKKDVNGGASADGRDELRYGLTLGGDTMGLDYRATYASHSGDVEDDATGDESDRSGNMIDVEVGYTLADVKNLRFYLYYHQDTGDSDSTDDKSEAYDSFFYEHHKNGGLMDRINWGNLTHTAAGVTLDATDDIKVGLHYHIFTKTEKDDMATDTVGSFAEASYVADEDAIGDEIDLVVDKSYGENFNMRLRLGQFNPGDAISSDADSQTDIFLQGTMTF